MNVFMPGGLGYIGSHTAVELLKQGHNVIILDNLVNSKQSVLDRIEKITSKRPELIVGDATDQKVLDEIFKKYDIDGVINFAGYKAVGESCKEPLKYYKNNIDIAIATLDAMKKHNVKNYIFSSTASIYADENNTDLKCDENTKVGNITNPYARSKYMIEQILQDLYLSDNSFNICILRYFNPIGANSSYLIGDDPKGFPNNLMPYILNVATGKKDKLYVFGNDYETHDGTGIRDYIHVEDLANAHIKALEYLLGKKDNGVEIFNIGTGTGYSVLDIVNAFEKVNNITIPYEIAPRRAGDVAYIVANCQKAKDILGFEANMSLEQMCKSSYEFAKKLQEEKK